MAEKGGHALIIMITDGKPSGDLLTKIYKSAFGLIR
jgi:hypothetical protein